MLNDNNNIICVVGLGYVGLPVAVAMSKRHQVIGFDINKNRIEELKRFIDSTNEVSSNELAASSNLTYTDSPSDIAQAKYIIVAVPTPVNKAKQPDLTPIIKASETVGKNMGKGAIVIYESTVYPGTTEEVCLPILEQCSAMKAGIDFNIGYSPERINPGDKEHTFTTIKKVVAADTKETLESVASLYESVVRAGVHRAESIKVAEAAKVIENTQRDLNIALMNELALIFNKLGIDTQHVLKAAGTKWNFLPFTPGLVGGHCIGVDPYYLTHKAESVGYYPEVILAGRRINDSMGSYIATALIKEMIHRNINIQGSTVTVLGLTFKENVPDLRNSKVIDVIRELQDFGVNVQVHDAQADSTEAEKEYAIQLRDYSELVSADALVLAVPHQEYLSDGWDLCQRLLKDGKGIVVDIKSQLELEECPDGIKLWRL